MTNNKNMRKWIILLLIILLAFAGYNYIYQDHRDISLEQAEFNITSQKIKNEFSNNLEASEKKYLNTTVEISGDITEINKNDLTLNDHVSCLFVNKLNATLQLNSKIKIKGRIIGYDDLLEQVKLDQCQIIQ